MPRRTRSSLVAPPSAAPQPAGHHPDTTRAPPPAPASRPPKRARPSVDGGRPPVAMAAQDEPTPATPSPPGVTAGNGAAAAPAPSPTAAAPPPPVAAAAASPTLGPRGLIRRTEYVRLLQQALVGLGHADVAGALAAAAGVEAEGPGAASLRLAVEAGDWEAALAALPALGLCPASSPRGRAAAYIILREAFLEALDAGDVAAALKTLRGRLAGLAPDADALRALSACLVAPPGGPALRAEAGWAGPEAGSRAAALAALEAAAPPGALLPPRRLEALVEQALDAQLAAARFFNGPPPAPRSLFRDFVASRGGIPSAAVQVLADHEDEVWHVAFSHGGRLLASGGADGAAILWEVSPRPRRAARANGSANGAANGAAGPPAPAPPPRLTKRATLRGHAGPVAVLAFSPDDATLATAGPDGTVRLWEVGSGECRATLTHHGALVTAVAWLPAAAGLAPPRLVTAGHDRTVHVCDGETGASLLHWRSPRVADLAVVPGGRFLLTSSSERRVRVWDVGAGGAEVLLPGGEGGGGGGSGGAAADPAVPAPAPAPGRAGLPPPPPPPPPLLASRELRAAPTGPGAPGSRPAGGAAAPGMAPTPTTTSAAPAPGGGGSPLVTEAEAIISLSLSPDGRALLLNLADQTLHEWAVGDALDGVAAAAGAGGSGGTGTTAAAARLSSSPSSALRPPPARPSMTFTGPDPSPGRFVVRSTFGGAGGRFVLAGAEDARVYVFHRGTGERLASLEGHTGTVNAVAWHPTDPGLFVSASDDHRIIVWSTTEDGAGAGSEEEEEE